MSLLTRGISRLSQLEIDVHKNWGGHRIDNLGSPDSGDDALRQDVAILRSLLTAQGQMIYAAGPGNPGVLAPPAAAKYLFHPGGAAEPQWANPPASSSPWSLLAIQTLGSQGSIDLQNLVTGAYPLLKLYLLVTAMNVSNNLRLTLQGDSSALYYVERIWASSGGVSQNQFQAQSYINLGLLGGESNIHKTFAEVTLFNPNEIDKLVLAHLSVIGQTSGNLFTNLTGGRYTSATVETITRITVVSDAGNLAAGSKAWLYGVA